MAEQPKTRLAIMPYAQIVAAPTTRPTPPITAVQRPACSTMAAGVAAELPLIACWCQPPICYDILMDEITHATELAALLAPEVAPEATELAPEEAPDATELAPEVAWEATEPAPEVAAPPALVASEATEPAPEVAAPPALVASEATEPAPEVAAPPALVASEATDPAPPVTVFTTEPIAEPATEVREEMTRRRLSAYTQSVAMPPKPTLPGVNVGGSLDSRFAKL